MGAPRDKGLTQKEESFCLAYTRLGGQVHGNAGKAYRLAFDATKCQPSTVYSKASLLLKRDKIRARIEELRGQAAMASGLTVEKVLRSLHCALEFDPRKLYRDDGTLKSVHELDDDTAAVLAAIEVVEAKAGDEDASNYTKKIKWLDKNTARDQAMKHFGLYKRDNEQRAPEPKPFDIHDAARTIAFMFASARKPEKKKQLA